MSTDQLRLDLADLAEEVTSVDLHSRVLHTSHTIGVRRAVTTSVVAVALFAMISGGALAVAGHLGTNRTPTGTTPASSTGPTTVSAPPTATTSTPPSTTPTAATAQINGTAYYVTRSASAQHQIALQSVTGGVARVVATFPASAGACPFYTVSVSPNGDRIAWITDSGTLYVANINGSHRKQVATKALCLGGAAIRWRDDSNFVGPIVNDKPVAVDASTAKITSSNVAASQLGVASPNGRYIAGTTTTGKRYVSTVNGSEQHDVSYTLPSSASSYDGWSISGISNDGQYVSVSGNPTDTSRNTESLAVVEVSSGTVVTLPVTGVRNIQFLNDGNVLVTTATRYVLLNNAFHVLTDEPVPASSTTGIWLTYIS